MKMAEEFGIFMKSQDELDLSEMDRRVEEEKHNSHLVPWM